MLNRSRVHSRVSYRRNKCGLVCWGVCGTANRNHSIVASIVRTPGGAPIGAEPCSAWLPMSRYAGRQTIRMGLQDALRAMVAAGGTIDKDWLLTRVLSVGIRQRIPRYSRICIETGAILQFVSIFLFSGINWACRKRAVTSYSMLQRHCRGTAGITAPRLSNDERHSLKEKTIVCNFAASRIRSNKRQERRFLISASLLQIKSRNKNVQRTRCAA